MRRLLAALAVTVGCDGSANIAGPGSDSGGLCTLDDLTGVYAACEKAEQPDMSPTGAGGEFTFTLEAIGEDGCNLDGNEASLRIPADRQQVAAFGITGLCIASSSWIYGFDPNGGAPYMSFGRVDLSCDGRMDGALTVCDLEATHANGALSGSLLVIGCDCSAAYRFRVDLG